MHVTGATVGKWRERFREFGLDGLLDEPRVGAPRKITDQQIEDVVTKTDRQRAIVSTHPGDGEAGEWRIRYGDETITTTEEYALISMLPGADAPISSFSLAA